MNKLDILQILGPDIRAVENSNESAVVVSISATEIDVIVTIPYGVNEILFEAKNRQGVTVLKDNFDFYGEFEQDDFQETLLDIADIARSPVLRFTNQGQTIEAKGYEWYYWFGKFSS